VYRKFWHQLLRRPLTAPANFFVHEVLQLPRQSVPAGALTLVFSFALSGILHTAAGVSSGMPAYQLGVFRFFCTNALGLMFEQGIVSLYRRVQGQDKSERQGISEPDWYIRAAGYVWVIMFMTWTGPSWIYPQAIRAPAAGPTAFLPFSVIRWYKS
jgi:hypothetical protein